MSDEESFVILGSTPTPSMDLYSVSSLNPQSTSQIDDAIKQMSSHHVKPIQDKSIDMMASNLNQITINSINGSNEDVDDEDDVKFITPIASLNPIETILISATNGNGNSIPVDIVDSSKTPPQSVLQQQSTTSPLPSSINTSILSEPQERPEPPALQLIINSIQPITEPNKATVSIMNDQPFSILNNLSENEILMMNKHEQREGSQESSLKNNIELAEKKLATLTNSDWAKISNNFSNSSSSPSSMLKQSFAEQIIMGSITRQDLHTKIAEEFPSLCSPTVINEDMNKLQLLICEHMHLKGNLEKTNIAMRQHFTMISKWQQNVKLFKESKQEEIAAYLETIDKFKKENAELIEESIHDKSIIQNYSAHFQNIKEYEEQKDGEINEMKLFAAKLQNQALEAQTELTKRNEQFELNLESAKLENDQLIKKGSEKDSIIANLRSIIEKYEQDRASFEFVPKNKILMIKSTKEEEEKTVPLAAHQAIVGELNRQLSIILAEKLEIKDMEKVYIDEVNCLKVNLTHTEELLHQAQNAYDELNAEFGGARGGGDDDDVAKEINDLNVKFTKEKSLLDEEIMKKNSTIDELNTEITVLKSQLDIYQNDFDIERQRCLDLACERDEILSDIQLLQRRNNQLMEETGKKASSVVPTNRSNNSTTAPAMAASKDEKSRGKFICPICSKRYTDPVALEGHVEDCMQTLS